MRENLKNKPAILYMARNKITDDFYIGVTCLGLKNRKHGHINASRRGGKGYFHRAIRKYGEEAFIWTKIGGFNNYEETLNTEIFLIKEMKPKYNMTIGGEGQLGFCPTEETRKKKSETTKGRKQSEEWVRKKADAIRGMKRTKEQCERQRQAHLGKPAPWLRVKHTPERIEASRLRRLGQKASDETRKKISLALMGKIKNKKSVVCLTDGKVFNTIKEASIFYNFESKNIIDVCKGKRPVTHGLQFKYLEAAT